MKKGTICLIIVSVLIIAAFILFAWPGFLYTFLNNKNNFKTVEIQDNVAIYDKMKVYIADNSIKKVGISDVTFDYESEKYITGIYEFEFDTVPQNEMSISLPAPKDLKISQDEEVFLNVGICVVDEYDCEYVVYDFIKGKFEGDNLTATIIPSDYEKPEEHIYASSGARFRRATVQKFKFDVGFTTKVTNRIKSEHFKMCFSTLDFISFSESGKDHTELVKRMEQIYNQMKKLGCEYKQRDEWPLDVYVETIIQRKGRDGKTPKKIDGYHVCWRTVNSAYIVLNSSMFYNN